MRLRMAYIVFNRREIAALPQTMNLQPVDFKAVAAKGAFVYCYLRADGSPYYVGIASTPYRPFHRHVTPKPVQKERIRVMRHSLDWEKACEWEQFYIKHYGRKDLKTGILRNRTSGGDGVLGIIFTDETKKKMSIAAKAKIMTAAQIRAQKDFAEWSKKPRGPLSGEHRAKLSKAAEGRVLSLSHRQALTTYWTGRELSLEHKAKISASNRGRKNSKNSINKMKEAAAKRSPEHYAKIKETHQRTTAAKYEVDVDWYLALPQKDKRKLCSRFCYGKRGADLIAGFAAA